MVIPGNSHHVPHLTCFHVHRRQASRDTAPDGPVAAPQQHRFRVHPYEWRWFSEPRSPFGMRRSERRGHAGLLAGPEINHNQSRIAPLCQPRWRRLGSREVFGLAPSFPFLIDGFWKGEVFLVRRNGDPNLTSNDQNRTKRARHDVAERALLEVIHEQPIAHDAV